MIYNTNTFRTCLKLTQVSKQISYRTKIVCIGSCFTENIGKKLQNAKFDVLINPTGIVYNPLSLAQSLQHVLTQRIFTMEDLRYFKDRWISLQHHGSFAHADPTACLAKINQALKIGHQYLKQADFLFLTLGTSFVYEHQATGQVVANCHQMPPQDFRRYKVEVDTIQQQLKSILEQIQQLNPTLHIVFTLSPIRHWKDGAIGNQVSKATLLLAIHKLTQNSKNIFYFPTYEIMMDDLRDYRFYEADMIHPNQVAINYIWEQFKQVYISESSWELMKKVQQIQQAANHRPRHPQSSQHRKFVAGTLKKITQLSSKHSFLDFSFEKKLLNKFC